MHAQEAEALAKMALQLESEGLEDLDGHVFLPCVHFVKEKDPNTRVRYLSLFCPGPDELPGSLLQSVRRGILLMAQQNIVPADVDQAQMVRVCLISMSKTHTASTPDSTLCTSSLPRRHILVCQTAAISTHHSTPLRSEQWSKSNLGTRLPMHISQKSGGDRLD